MKGPIIKIIIGAIFIIASIYYLVAGPAVSWLTKNKPYVDFLILLNGGIPILVFLIGLFVVWLELDELRIERELAVEEKKKKKK